MSKQAAVMEARLKKLASILRVALPVMVNAFSPEALTVDVQPLIRERIDGGAAPLPLLVAVPVAVTGSAGIIVRPWYKRGDIGVVLFCDKAIDTVLEAGAISDANTERLHSLEDAVFVGGLVPASKPISGLPHNALVLAAGGAYIALTEDGRIDIRGSLTVNGAPYGGL